MEVNQIIITSKTQNKHIMQYIWLLLLNKPFRHKIFTNIPHGSREATLLSICDGYEAMIDKGPRSS